jgi:hypothetical protein
MRGTLTKHGCTAPQMQTLPAEHAEHASHTCDMPTRARHQEQRRLGAPTAVYPPFSVLPTTLLPPQHPPLHIQAARRGRRLRSAAEQRGPALHAAQRQMAAAVLSGQTPCNTAPNALCGGGGVPRDLAGTREPRQVAPACVASHMPPIPPATL